MKGLLKLFVRSILCPETAAIYLGLSVLVFISLAKRDHFFIGLFLMAAIMGSLTLIHIGRRAYEKAETEAESITEGTN